MKANENNDTFNMPPISGLETGTPNISDLPEIKGYENLSILNEGGMGVVYLAHQMRPLPRQVAIKVIKPGMDSRQVLARFATERQSLALLDHPNIAQVYDAGATTDGRPYFAMEYVKGLPITEYCDRNKIGIEERLSLFKSICEAMQHAHTKGIIHRDLKPSNILVYTDDDQIIAKIIDFGVAKAIGPKLTDRTVFTQTDQFIGTPEYMSPEQADMASNDVDTRADIYSLGAVLYELLTGTLPFESDTLRQGGLEHLRYVIRNETPQSPSTRLASLGMKVKPLAHNRCTKAKALIQRLHKELEWIPLKAMRKERTRRYRSAAELADDIQHYLDGTPLIAGPESVVYILSKFIKRRRALVVGITTVLVILMVSIILSVFFAVRAQYALANQKALSDWIYQQFFASVHPAEDPNHDPKLRPVLKAAAHSLQESPLEQPLVEAYIREKILGETFQKLSLYEEAEIQYQYALDIYQDHLGEDNPNVLVCMMELGWVQYHLNQHAQAVRLLEKAIVIGKRLSTPDPYHVQLSMCLLGEVYMAQGELDKARQILFEVIETEYRLLEQVHPSRLKLVEQLFEQYIVHQRDAEAEILCMDLINIFSDFEEDNIYTLYARNMLVALGIRQKRFDEMETVARESYQKCRKIIGNQEELTLLFANSLGIIYMELGRFGDAEETIRQTLNEQPKTLNWSNTRFLSRNEVTLLLANNLGFIYREQGRYSEAAEILYWALNKLPNCQDGNHTEAPNYKESKLLRSLAANLGYVYIKQKRFEDAEPLLIKAEALMKTAEDPPHVSGRSSNKVISYLIELYEEWGKHDRADDWRGRLQKCEKEIENKTKSLL